MSLDLEHLIKYIIKPSLKQVDMYSVEAEQLLLTTGQVESSYKYVHQIGGGPALGLWQMEPATYESIFNDYLAYRSDLKKQVLSACCYKSIPPAEEIMYNMKFAVIMSRIKYYWVPYALPEFNDIEGQAHYWSKYYNGNPVTGDPNKYINAYNQHIRRIYE